MAFEIEDLQKDLQLMLQRKDIALQNLHQLIGACSILEQQLNKLMNPVKEDEQESTESQETEKEEELTDEEKSASLADLHVTE